MPKMLFSLLNSMTKTVDDFALKYTREYVKRLLYEVLYLEAVVFPVLWTKKPVPKCVEEDYISKGSELSKYLMVFGATKEQLVNLIQEPLFKSQIIIHELLENEPDWDKYVE